MYTAEQVRGLLRQQKNICANILIEKNGKATVGDMWDAPEPELSADGIRPPLPDNCIINPHYDRKGYLDGGLIVEGGIIRGHIDAKGEEGPQGCAGVTIATVNSSENIKESEVKEIKIGEIFTIEGKSYVVTLPVTENHLKITNGHGAYSLSLDANKLNNNDR